MRARTHVDMATRTFTWPGKHFMLDQMTVYELKTMAKDHGLLTTGLKADLVWRIEQHLHHYF